MLVNQITTENILAHLIVFICLYFSGNAIARYLSPAANTKDMKETKRVIGEKINM